MVWAGLLLAAWWGPQLAACGDDPVPEAPLALANRQALVRMADWRLLPVFGPGAYRQTSSYDRTVNPRPAIVLHGDGNQDMNNFVCKSADAKYKSMMAGPLFDLPSCPESHVRGLVMARVDGPGYLSRLHLNLFSRMVPELAIGGEEIFRVYVDDAKAPLIEARLDDILSGAAGPMFRPPFVQGTPKLLIWYYPLRFTKRLILAIDNLDEAELVYFQAATVVGNDATLSQQDEVQRVREATALHERFTSSPATGSLQPLVGTSSVVLQPGGEQAVLDLDGPATIHRFRLSLLDSELPKLEEVRLLVTWESAPTPSFELPLVMLFAASQQAPSQASLAMTGAANGATVELELRLPMPFASHARWVLRNDGTSPATFDLAIDGEHEIPTEPWGHLVAVESLTVGPTTTAQHVIAAATGQGRYVGHCNVMQGHTVADPVFGSPFNFLEGDHNATIDGEWAIRGNGSEDWYNSGFYFGEYVNAGGFSSPYAQAWGIATIDTDTPPRGLVTACRWTVLADAIDFRSSFEMTMELGPFADGQSIDQFRTVAFLYR